MLIAASSETFCNRQVWRPQEHQKRWERQERALHIALPSIDVEALSPEGCQGFLVWLPAFFGEQWPVLLPCPPILFAIARYAVLQAVAV